MLDTRIYVNRLNTLHRQMLHAWVVDDTEEYEKIRARLRNLILALSIRYDMFFDATSQTFKIWRARS